MFYVTTARFRLELSRERQPARHRAQLVDEFEVADERAGPLCCVQVARPNELPFLVVAQRFDPSADCFFPGVALVDETSRLFVGAGTRILCYDLERVAQLWEDEADTGFLWWQRHGDVVVMMAELELAAWDHDGTKLWSTFVEPPYDYRVEEGVVHLDVMGKPSSFPLRVGPAR